MPDGFDEAVGPKMVSISGRDLLKHMAAQFEDAVEHAAQEAKRAAEGAEGGEGQPADPPPAG